MTKSRFLCVVLVMALAGSTAVADSINGINMDFVSIGYAGNAADGGVYGAVGYSYRISQYEVSWAQFAPSLIGDQIGGNENRWVSTVGSNAPVVFLSRAEAAMYCNWLTSGNTTNGAYTISGGLVTAIDRDAAISEHGTVYVMPTEDEWYKAAYYNGATESYHTYANAADMLPSQGDARYSLTTPGATTSPWDVSGGSEELNGTYNMMGNVAEHLETQESGNVVYRGGSYYLTQTALDSSFRDTFGHSSQYSTVGMRIVAIPEPGTISLMSLSTVGLFLTRTSRRRRLAGRSLLPIRREENFIDAFCSEEEWQVSGAEVEVEDGLSILFDLARHSCVRGWTAVHGVYKNADKAFWNHMVSRYERKLARRKAFRHALHKKSLDCLDGFLARIMK